MAQLELRNIIKIYPYTKVSGLFGRKKARERLKQQRMKPFTTNEGVIAVQKFDLDINDGEFIVLLGPSGCGKTTLLRMIAGLEEVSAGEIIMDGKVINALKPEKRDVAMIFQNYSLYPHFSVYDNIAFPLRNQHIPREELDNIVGDVAEILELTPYLNKRPKNLSGGQMQRAAIGRAIVRKPRIFLMDEPFSNLDATLRQKLRQTIKQLHQKLGTTFVYVTHDQNEAFYLGDRVVVMRDGLIKQIGTPPELYNHPADLYTATFIGSPQMNVFRDVTLKKDGEDWTVSILGKQFTLAAAKCNTLTNADDGRGVIVGIRPVNIAVANEGVDAEVEYTEPIGAETHVHLTASNAHLVAVIDAASVFTSGIMRGAKLRFHLDARRFYLFDAKTEQRIL